MNEQFVGRDKELQQLKKNYEVIASQLPHKSNLILVEGEAGAGKSTLIRQFVEIIKSTSRASPLFGLASCEIFAKETSFLPFYQLLDSFRDQKDSLSRISNLEKFNRTIGEVAPSWLKMLPFVGGAIADTVNAIRNLQEETYKSNSFIPSQQAETDIYGQFLKIILRLSESRPVLMIVDDLQWADEESARLFTYLARRLPEKNNRIMLVGAYRSYDLANQNKLFQETLLDIEKRGQSVRVRPPSFEIEDLSMLLERIYGLSAAEVSVEIKKKLITHTSGNPLFITELLKQLEEDNKLVLINEKWRFLSLEDISENLPESLDAALEQRIDHLEKRLRELLTVASVEGESFTAEVLSKIKNVELVEVLNTLVEDLSKNYRLVHESGEIEIALNNFASLYAFRHGLIRDYIYKNLSHNQKRLLHQQVGDCIESLYGEKRYAVAYQLANHYLVAKDYLKIAKYGLIVARQEFEKFSPKQALWWSKTVIDAIHHAGGNDEVSCSALLITIQAYVHLGRNDDALMEIEKLISLSGISDIQFGVSELLKGEVLTRKGALDTAINSLRVALKIFTDNNELQYSGWALRRLAHIFAVRGNFTESERYSEEGLAILDNFQDSISLEVKGTIWSDIAEYAIAAGDMQKAEKANHLALDIFQKIKNKKGEAIMLGNLGGIEYMYGNIIKSEAFTRRSYELFCEIEDAENIISSSDNLARSLIVKGEIMEAKQLLLDAEPIAIQMNEVGFLPEIYIHLSEIALLENNKDDAVVYSLKSTQSVEIDDQYSAPRAHCIAAISLLEAGRFEEAKRYMDIAFEMVTDASFTFVYVKALIYFDYAKFLFKTDAHAEQIIQLCKDAKEAFLGLKAHRDFERVITFEQFLQSNI